MGKELRKVSKGQEELKSEMDKELKKLSKGQQDADHRNAELHKEIKHSYDDKAESFNILNAARIFKRLKKAATAQQQALMRVDPLQLSTKSIRKWNSEGEENDLHHRLKHPEDWQRRQNKLHKTRITPNKFRSDHTAANHKAADKQMQKTHNAIRDKYKQQEWISKRPKVQAWMNAKK